MIPNSSTTPMFEAHPSALRQLVDYTKLSVGLRIEGRLSNGVLTHSTTVCPKCNRVGLMSVKLQSSRIVVHRGVISVNILRAEDFCEI